MTSHDIMREAAENYRIYSNELKVLADKIAAQNRELFSDITWSGAAIHNCSTIAEESVSLLNTISTNLRTLEHIIDAAVKSYDEVEADVAALAKQFFD